MKLKHGFTLIEVVVAVGLMTAISGVLMAQFRNYNRQQAVRGAAERLQQVYNEAKTNALAGKKDCAVCGGVDQSCNEVDDGPLTGWKVVINPTAGPMPGVTNGYRIEGHCWNLVGGTPTNLTFMTRDEQFPATVAISTEYGSPPEVMFLPINGGTNLDQSVYVRVTGTGGGQSEFMVSSAGEVVPPVPTPTPTLIPAATNTPTPTMASNPCTVAGGKCVPVTDVCYPSGTSPHSCSSPAFKCVNISANCGAYTCTGALMRCQTGPCGGGYPVYVTDPAYTCPPSGWICCSK